VRRTTLFCDRCATEMIPEYQHADLCITLDSSVRYGFSPVAREVEICLCCKDELWPQIEALLDFDPGND
jgi:hypothetical protein